jgi:predicted neuraminidase
MKVDGSSIAWGVLVLTCFGMLLTEVSESATLRFSGSELATGLVGKSVAEPELSFVRPPGGPPSVHSGTITRRQDGQLLAAWFGGMREGASDVKIYFSRRAPGAAEWSAPTTIVSREQTTEDLNRHIVKIGNPILFADSRDRIWLFYVTVSFGGWSGSSITVRYSDDAGESWSKAKRLVTSPFLNVGTLVKGCPIECESGHIMLPVYQEFVRMFGEALILDHDGSLHSKIRLTATHGAIQPWIVPLDRQESIAFFRQSGHADRSVLMCRMPNVLSSDCGRLETSQVPNPNSGIAVIRRHNGELLMVCNPIESGRHRLSLATSSDGVSWKLVRHVEDSDAPDEFSYPYLIRGAPGQYHMIYTWNRTRMRYLEFDEEWLENEL